MNVEAIAQGLASEHGDERNALRVIVQSHMNLELEVGRRAGRYGLSQAGQGCPERP
jgi:hypothetical protein